MRRCLQTLEQLSLKQEEWGPLVIGQGRTGPGYSIKFTSNSSRWFLFFLSFYLPIGWEQEEASWGIPPAEAGRDLWPSNFLPSLLLRHSLKTALITSWSVDLFSLDRDMEKHGIIMTIYYSLQIYLPPCSKCDKPLWPYCGPRRIKFHWSSERRHLMFKLHGE